MSDTTLRSGLIRLAFANPELRADLLPLIEKEAAGKKQDKVRAVNQNGTVVWVKKDTLRDNPGKFKPYKHEEDTGKGGGAEQKSEKKDEGKKDEGGGVGREVKLSPRLSDTLSAAVSSQREHSDELRKVWGLSAGGKPIPADTAKKAISQINALLKSKKKLSDKDKKDLSGAVYLLEYGAKDPKKDWAQSGGSKSEKPKAEAKKTKLQGVVSRLSEKKQKTVMTLATKHNLESDELTELDEKAKSLADKDAKSKMSPTERKNKFLAAMERSKYDSPEAFAAAKERIEKMSAGDFEKLVFALASEDEAGAEGGGKTASLRAGLIRLAYANPDLRPTLLPLIAKHAGGDVAQAKKAIEGLARLVAAKVGGTVGSVGGHTYADEGFVSAKAEIVIPNLPAITSGGDDDAVVEVYVGVNPYKGGAVLYFRYVLAPPHLRGLADEVAILSVSGANIKDVVQKATKSAQALPAVLEPVREREALRRKSAETFKKAMPDMKEWLRKALIQSGFMGSVKVWGHPVGSSGVFTTDAGIPYAAERIVIEGLLTESEGRDVQRSQEVLVNTRKVLAKALPRFFSNGVAAKLSSKPAYWSSYTYNTTVILYFKDAPVENMKLAGDEGDMAAVLEAEADPTSHDQNLPEHYYFGKTAEERLENIEKMLSQFASPKSKDQNKPQSYYGLPPKGKQAFTMQAARKPEGVAERHQLKILLDTVRNPMKGFLGGPSAEEAEETLRNTFGYSEAEIRKLKASV